MAIETIGYSAAGGWSIPRLFAGAEYTASLAGVGAWPAGASGARLVVIAKVRGGMRVAESAEITPDAPTARISFLTAEFRDIFRALYPTDSVTVRLEVITAEGDLVAAANQACGVSHLLWREEADSVPSCPSGVSVVAASLAAHVARTDNPHAVTAAQCGADVAGASEAAVAAHDADLAAHADIRSAVASAEVVAAAAQSAASGVAEDLAAHEGRSDNPHGVTEAQVRAVSSARVFGALAADNSWANLNSSVPRKFTQHVSDEQSPPSAMANVVHITAPDDGDGPSAWMSGIAASVPAGSSADFLVVMENTATSSNSFTLYFDFGRILSKGIYPINAGGNYYTAYSLSPGAMAFVRLTVWRRDDGKQFTIVHDLWRTDWLDDRSAMAPRIFDGTGKAWGIVAQGDGGMATVPIL